MSDEEFSVLPDFSKEETEEGLKQMIDSYKKKHQTLLDEQQELAADIEANLKLKQEFEQRTEKLTQSLQTQKKDHEQKISQAKEELNQLQQDHQDLASTMEQVKQELEEQESSNSDLRQQIHVFRGAPERDVKFLGQMGDDTDADVFDMRAKIRYPMEGGTALVTFENEAAASKVVELQSHVVKVGEDCRITVEAKPVHLLMPKHVKVQTEVSHTKILVSNLPNMDPEIMCDKLELHFSKTLNGGGEIVSRELLVDSEAVVLTFVNDNISPGLIEREFHDVKLQQKQKHRVRVTPFLNGEVTHLQTELTLCPRTVLLTGIVDVMDQDALQDQLEIHFQKSGNGGGEIEAIHYNALGQQAEALFESVEEA